MLGRSILGASALVLSAALSQEGIAADAGELLRLRAATERIELQLALVKTSEPYLVVDLPAGAIELWRDGARLRRYPIVGTRIASPRVAFIRRASNIGPALQRLTGLTLVPARPVERLELHANDGGPAPPLPEIPPTPAEAIPTPPRFELRSAEGFVLEFVADQVEARPTVADRIADAAGALGLVQVGGPRLRVALPVEDASAFYRAAPDGAGALLILANPD